MTAPIPSPPAIPFLGHVNTIDSTLPLRSMYLLSQQYGEIIQLTTFGKYHTHGVELFHAQNLDRTHARCHHLAIAAE